MWGVRVIRVVVLLGGVMATVAGSGCKCFYIGYPAPSTQEAFNRHRWLEVPPQNTNEQSGSVPNVENQPGLPKTRDMTPVERKAATGFWFENQRTPVAPERIHGGIY